MALNVEMSLSKARELLAREHGVSQAAMPINLPVVPIDNEPPEAPNVLVDAVSQSAASDAKQTKPLVRHVLVKDLNKIGDRLKMNLPKTGIFGKKAPVGLYALFDGQSCTGQPGPAAAEFCARNLHTKLLKRLTALQPDPSEFVVEGVLRETFDDLDQELLTARPEITDGCGAAVALLIGNHVIAATLGRCGSVLCEAGPTGRLNPVSLVGGRGNASAQQQSLQQCLGEFWEYDNGQLSQCRYVSITPEVRSVALRDDSAHPCLVMTSSTVMEVLSVQQLADIAQEFPRQPRASCGEIVCQAAEARAAAGVPAQCTAVAIGFLPPREDKKAASSEPAAKRPKVQTPRGGGTHSMRLRHILIGFSDTPQEVAAAAALPKKRTPANPRTRHEAEALLRWAIGELRKELKASKRPPKDAMELVNLTNKKFAELAKEYSECDTARQGGNTSGDLGWLTLQERANFGAGFKEVVDVLLPGQFSDIAVSDRGLHLVQRLA